MSPEEFWRSNLRIVNLTVEGYRRRRAWLAFHSGYGIHCKDAKLDHLLGIPDKPAAMSADQMLATFERWEARRAALDAKRQQKGGGDGG